MIDAAFVASLACPYCRSRLALRPIRSRPDGAIELGTVACACYEYPIVDGILVLRQLSGPADTIDPAVVRLRAGDIDGARAQLVTAASMLPRAPEALRAWSRARVRALAASARRRLTRTSSAPVALGESPVAVHSALYSARPAGFAAYLYQRYANPSFVASIPLMALLAAVEAPPSGRARAVVLDLGCGVGHSTAMMRALFPSMDYVAADPDFVNLQMLRQHFVEDATCVCLDAELPLPFADDAFDAVFCLDAFHYIRSKWALSRELDRAVERDGVWIFPHLHNADVANVSPGIPLPPKDYLRMLEFADATLLDEAGVLQRFMSEGVLDVACAGSVESLGRTPDLSMFASRRRLEATRYDVGARLLAAAKRSRVGVNPIYRAEPTSDGVSLEMRWPDAALERECAAIRAYLPARVDIERGFWQRLELGALAPEDDARVADLVRSLVLLPLPPGYARAQRSGVTPP